MRSKRDNKVGDKLMFSTIDNFGLYRDSMGFADAKTEVLAFKVAMIPALATETVCCSMASCKMDRAESDILSNSSMQQTPRSDNTSAPVIYIIKKKNNVK